MKFIVKSLLVLFVMGMSTPTEAQFLKRLKKAVQSGAEDAVIKKSEQKAEQETEKKMDEILNNSNEENLKRDDKSNHDEDNRENAQEKKQRENEANAMLEMFAGKKVETRDRYNFDVVATMQTESFDGKNEKHILKQGYGTNCIYTSVDEMETPMIHDFDNEAMIILHNEKKEAQVMSLDWMTKLAGDQTNYADNGAVDVRKTGNTKTLLGYTCDEYIITHEDGKMIAWFAPKVDFSFDDYWNGFAKFFKSTVDPTMLEKNGYTMEMTIYDEKGEKASHMKVTELNTKGMDIDLQGFKVKSMFEN